MEINVEVAQKTNIDLSYNPAIPLLNVPKEIQVNTAHKYSLFSDYYISVH